MKTRTGTSKSLGATLAICAALPGGFVAGKVSAAQPHMQETLEHLQSARGELQAADNDKGGHRVKALSLVDEAIEQVRKGMRFDRRR